MNGTPQDVKRPSLCLTVQGTVGSDIEDCMKEACVLAARLGIAYVCFNGNGMEYTCYDYGRVLRFDPLRPGPPASWTGATGWSNKA
jgi:hypothetical protein